MPYTNITKFFLLVILGVLMMCTANCTHSLVSGGEPPDYQDKTSPYSEPQTAGRVESSEINESSGLVASQCQPDTLWTHNDSEEGPYLFALDGKGKGLGTWKVAETENVDWEDMGLYKDPEGNCFLYIGDIGNQRKNPRTEHTIYRVAEPKVPTSGSGTTKKTAGLTAPAEAITFAYPDETHDSETLMVHPVSGEIYVITKSRFGAAGVYKLKPPFVEKTVRPERVSDISVPAIPNGFLTGGSIAPDGKRLVICDYFAAYEFSLPPDAKSFDEIWKQKPSVINLGPRDQGEAVAYSADGNSLFATSEGKQRQLIRVTRR
ncbi:MAG: hypothetical protein AB7F88_01155 [Pyrinomonadaceae bacterium]